MQPALSFSENYISNFSGKNGTHTTVTVSIFHSITRFQFLSTHDLQCCCFIRKKRRIISALQSPSNLGLKFELISREHCSSEEKLNLEEMKSKLTVNQSRILYVLVQ